MSNRPKIRFNGYQSEWQADKFLSVFTQLKNNTLSRAELNDKEGNAKNVHYGDILIKFGELLDAEKESIPFITSDELAEKLSSFALQNGDIIIADTAEDSTVGKCTEIGNVSEDMPVVSGLHTIPVRPNADFASGYLGHFMNSDAYHDQLLPLIQGTKVSSIAKTYLGETDIRFPSDISEQEKIASFLQYLNALIIGQQQKYEKLVALKSACLEKMFPQKDSVKPELRLKGFTDSWEERKLEEFVTFFSGLTYSPNDTSGSGVLVLRSSNVKNDEIVDADNVYVVPEAVNSEYVRKGDIVVVVRNGSRALIGKHARIKKDMPNTVIGAFMTGIRCKHSSFVNALLNTSRFDMQITMNLGATINQITGYMFSNMTFYIPSDEKERDAIGDYFEKLENLIFCSQIRVEKLKQFKQAVLNNMFV